MAKTKISENVKNLALIRGWMLDIFYNSCGSDIKEIFGDKASSELKILEKKEARLLAKLNK